MAERASMPEIHDPNQSALSEAVPLVPEQSPEQSPELAPEQSPPVKGVVLQLADGTIAACNAAAEQLLGFSVDQIRGWTSAHFPWQTIHADGTPFAGESHPAMVALQTGQPQCDVIMGLYHPDGQLIWLKIDAQPLFQSSNAAPYAVMTSFSATTPPQWQSTPRSLQQTCDRLTQRETLYRILAQHIPNGSVVLYDRNLRYLLCEGSELERVGLNATAMVGKTVWEVFPPEVCEQIEPQYRAALAGETIVRQIAFQGQVYETCAVPVRDERHEIYAGMVLTQNVTNRIQSEAERERAEAALRESEARNQLAMEVARMFAFEWEVSADRVKRSAQCASILGLTGDAVEQDTGAKFLQRIHPDDRDRFAAILQSLTPDQSSYRTVYRVLRPDQQVVTLEESGRAQFDAQGQLIRLIGMTADVTEQKQVEVALSQSEETVRWRSVEIESLYATAPIGLCFIDSDLRFVRINERLAQINGPSVADHLGRTVREVLPDLADATEQLLRSLLETGEPLLNVEIQGETPAQPGVQRTWREHFLPLKDGDRVIGISTVCEEITDDKRREADRQQTELALREANIQLEAALAAGSIYTWRWRILDNRVMVDRNFASLFGVDPDAAAAGLAIDHFLDAIHPDDRTGVTAAIQQAIETGEDYTAEYRVRNAEGQERWVIARGRAEYDAQGRAIAFPGALADITNLKQAESALRQNAARLEFILHTAEFGTWEVDLGVLPYVAYPRSLRHDQIYGYDALHPNWNYDTFMSHIHPDDRALVEEKFLQTLAHHTDWEVECRIIRADQSERWVWISGSIYRDEAGQPVRLIGLIADITDRKRTEAELRQKNAILNVINESIPTPIYVKDCVGRITFANPATLQILGKSACEVIGYRDDEIYPGLGEIVVQNDRRIMETGEAQSIEESPDGVRTFLSVKVPFRDEEGRVIGLIGVSSEITERKQSQQEKQRLLESERAARLEAERANRIKDEFLAVLSHELRSPLNPILGWTRLLQGGKLPPTKATEALTIIERNAKLQSQLVEDLLDISRILRGKLTLNVASVDLAATTSAALETVCLAAEAKNIQLQLELGDVRPIMGDAGRLQQVIWNLLTNAIKFTPDRGRVRVCLAQTESSVQIEVSDTGKGISADFLPYVFEHFRQEDGTTTRRFGGLGLGLSIVRQIVEMHGGTVCASSSGEGQGATFTVTLPLSRSIEEGEIRRWSHQEQTPLSPSAAQLLDGIRILVVDDDGDSREFVAFLLEQSGAAVVQASSAFEGLQLLARSQFDLLVSDIGMPDMDGYSFVRRVRTQPPEAGGRIPAIALTAYAGELDQQQAMQAGFQRHLAKPVELEQLAKAIVNLVQK